MEGTVRDNFCEKHFKNLDELLAAAASKLLDSPFYLTEKLALADLPLPSLVLFQNRKWFQGIHDRHA